MVSTRGGARTSGGNSMEPSLRKKPVRKTAVKPTPTAAKPKTARAKKADLVQDTADMDDEQDELQEESVAPAAKSTKRAPAKKPEEDAPKATKKAVSRVKKDEEPAKAPPAAKPAAKFGRPKGSTKTVKAKSTESDNKKPELPPPAEGNGTRATRATASTTAKGRAPPLSPKKITQVSKVQPRTTKPSTAEAAVTKPTVTKPARRGRPPTRKQNVSDENAEHLELPSKKQTIQEEAKETRGEDPSQRITSNLKDMEKETARPATPPRPNDTLELHADKDEDAIVQDHDAASKSDGESESDAVSVDELLGPKTPLKRCSPREATRFISTQKSAPRIDPSIKTPVRRFAVLGTQQGTPQTQKPYCNPRIPMSELRPMTVARARDCAMVFPKLQPFPKLKDNEDIEDWEDSDTPEEQDTHMKHLEHDQMPAQLGDLAETMSRMEDSELLELEDEDEPQMNDEPNMAVGSEEAAEVQDHEEIGHNHTAGSSVDDGAANDDNGNANTEQETGALHTIDSTLSATDENQAEPGIEDMDVAMEDAQTMESTPQPETLVWQNVHEDVAIPFEFEVDLSASRTLPPVEPTERLSIAAAFERSSSAEPETKEDAIAVHSFENTKDLSTDEGEEQSDAPASVDATVNLSDFLDVKSLVEPRHQEQEVTRVDLKETEPMSAKLEAAVEEGSPSPVKAHITPARNISELDIALEDIQDDTEIEIPRYARPTIASRRKSLPAIFYCTPTKHIDRPMTAIGASMPRVAVPYGNYLFADATTLSKVTPARPRPSTAHGLASEKKLRKASQTPITGSPIAKTSGTSVPDTVHISRGFASPSRTPRPRISHAGTPGTSVPDSARPTPRERFPGLPSRTAYDLESTLVNALPSANKERFPGLPPHDSYESFAEDTQIVAMQAAENSPSVRTPKVTWSATKERYPDLPPSKSCAENFETPVEEQAEEGEPSPPAPAAGERYPGLRSKRSYAEHAMTAMPPSRFRTPTQSPAKRPATVQKPASLRKVALKATTPRRTPLKAPTMTPGTEPMTPHPAAPLRGVVALVEVFTSDGGCATPAFTVLLQRLGAKTTKNFSERITHLVFKEGSPTTLQRLRVHNKQVAETGVGHEIYCVNSRWVSDCDTGGRRMDETDEAYAVDVEDVPRAGKRRRKSMEPTALRNIAGNVVRDRKSNIGRSSLSRNSFKPGYESPSELDATPKDSAMDKENGGDDRSPATPAYLAAPDSLVQQTAPMNRVRKLDFNSKESEKSRRLTFFNGEF